jgi:hypothetical protein
MSGSIGQMRSYAGSLGMDLEKITKALDGGANSSGVKFVSEILMNGGVLEDDLFKTLKTIAVKMELSKNVGQMVAGQWGELWKKSNDFNYDDEGKIVTRTPRGRVDQKYDDSRMSYRSLQEKMKAYQAKAFTRKDEAQEAAEADEVGKAKEGMGRREAAGFDRLVEAGILRMADGGSVSSVLDSVPAMLTPGEFVMSPEAVRKHGVGFMKSINRGHVPGFRRGGLVGSGVAYRQRGGEAGAGGGMTLSLDAANIQGVLDNFNATFAATLDNVIVQFSQIGEGLNNLAAALSSGMVMTHNFTGDLALAFKIENADVLKKTIADAIAPRLSEIITSELDKRLDKDFKAGS